MPKESKYQTKKIWKLKDTMGAVGIGEFSDLFSRLLSQRGISSEEEAQAFVFPNYEDLTSPNVLSDMDKAVSVITESINNNEKIAIYGDYDVDGISGTALLADFFKKINVETVNYIPSRVDEGYGLNDGAIERLAKLGVKLIITVDCGTTSFGSIDLANRLGVKVVVTDHHVLKPESSTSLVPRALAVVNPKRENKENPLYEISGVAVAFYLVRALQEKFLNLYPRGQEKWLLDLVCLGTICDVVPLRGENRVLAKYGLSVLSKTRRPGLVAIAETSNMSLALIDSYKVGFMIGPRLNAAGRIEHANLSLELLITDDKDRAKALAEELNKLNIQRQELTEKIIEEARNIINAQKGQKIYLLSNKDWPSGVVGIVASRLVEEFSRPMLIMEDLGDQLKGSARSINGFNIINALSLCGDLLLKYGGHEYAAGFSLKKSKFKALEDKLKTIAEEQINIDDLVPEINIDLEILSKNLDQKFIEELSLLEPYGRENNKPLFLIREVALKDARLVGNPATHLKLVVEQNGIVVSGIAFNYGDKLDLEIGDKYDLVVTVGLNEWNNQKKPEFKLIDLRKCK